MKKIIVLFLLTLLIAPSAWGATQFTDGTADHKWSTAGNWSDGKPDAADAVTVAAGVTAIEIDEAATCLSFDTNAASGAVTISGTGNLTVAGNSTSPTFRLKSGHTWSNTGTLSITLAASVDNMYFGGGTVSASTVSITAPAAKIGFFNDASTFGNLTLAFTCGSSYANTGFRFAANITVSGALSVTSTPLAGSSVHGAILSNSIGTARTITTNGTVSITGPVMFRDITAAGTASPWDLSGIPSGNLGGNSNITFRTAAPYYLYCGTANSKQNYEFVWSATDDQELRAASGTAFPVVQDTIVIDDYSWDDTGNTFLFHSSTFVGTVDISGLTEANTVSLPSYALGDLIYTGSGLTIPPSGYNLPSLDARLKGESSDTLDVNITKSSVSGNSTFVIDSYDSGAAGRGVKFVSNLDLNGTLTLTRGTVDLNGKTITANVFSSSNSNTRVLKDTAGGAKIVLNGLTGTIFDTTTATNMTISNAPDIDIGDSNNTLTGDVTFIGSAKTYGDFTVKKHAGNYDCIITGANTFGALTIETPDATYQYSDLKLPGSATTTITSLVSDGTASYKPNLQAASGTATLSDTTGTNTLSNTTITGITAQGGATWLAYLSSGNVDGTGNTGWTFEDPADTTPDAFTFTDVTNAARSTQYTSNQITVAGTDTPADVSITGGTYSKNGGAYTSDAGTADSGDTFTVRCTSSSSWNTAVNVVLTIGGVSDTYTVTTLAEDTTPTAFSFTDVTGATKSTVYTSETITVAGINSTAVVSITGGTYSKNGAAYTSDAGTAVLGDAFAVRATSSALRSTAVNVALTIGGVSDTYSVTTGTWVETFTVCASGCDKTTPQGAFDDYAILDGETVIITGDYSAATLDLSGVAETGTIYFAGTFKLGTLVGKSGLSLVGNGARVTAPIALGNNAKLSRFVFVHE